MLYCPSTCADIGGTDNIRCNYRIPVDNERIETEVVCKHIEIETCEDVANDENVKTSPYS